MKRVKQKGFIDDFDWGLYPKAENFLKLQLNIFLSNNKSAKKIIKKIEDGTSTRFFDWVDHIVIPEDNEIKLKKLEFEKHKNVFKHTRTVFFSVILGKTFEVALKSENLGNVYRNIQGKKNSRYRKSEITKEKNYLLSVVERRGYDGFTVENNSNDIHDYERVLKEFRQRKRQFSGDQKGMEETKKLVNRLSKKISKARVADAFFRAERDYWTKKNKAGKIQKKRQNAFGMGWGNHDHHTYRSSRENFTDLNKIFENLGLIKRESFHAGEQAGWGAQILEHPKCDIVVFADLDLEKDEQHINFASEQLKSNKKLGTVGLWVGLHGESILEAGMHHLECRFNFDKLRKDLLKFNIKIMAPFSYFPFLKQAFTVGEKWTVNKKRAMKLLKNKLITKEQYNRFVTSKVIGSHMENLERNQGFKGFNQESVSAVISATDPRMMKRGA